MMKRHKGERKRKFKIQVNVFYAFCRYGFFCRSKDSCLCDILITRQASHCIPFAMTAGPARIKARHPATRGAAIPGLRRQATGYLFHRAGA